MLGTCWRASQAATRDPIMPRPPVTTTAPCRVDVWREDTASSWRVKGMPGLLGALLGTEKPHCRAHASASPPHLVHALLLFQRARANHNLAHVPRLAHLAQRGAHGGQAVHDARQRAQRAAGQVSRQAGQRGLHRGRRQEVDGHQAVTHVGALCREAWVGAHEVH